MVLHPIAVSLLTFLRIHVKLTLSKQKVSSSFLWPITNSHCVDFPVLVNNSYSSLLRNPVSVSHLLFHTTSFGWALWYPLTLLNMNFFQVPPTQESLTFIMPYITASGVLDTGIFEQQRTNTQMYLSAPKSSFTAIEPHDTQQAVFITVDFSSCPLLPLSTVMAQFISPLNLTFLGWRGLFFSLVKWAAADSSLTTHHDWPLISPSPYFPNEIVSPDLQVKTLM